MRYLIFTYFIVSNFLISILAGPESKKNVKHKDATPASEVKVKGEAHFDGTYIISESILSEYQIFYFTYIYTADTLKLLRGFYCNLKVWNSSNICGQS